MVRLVLRQGMKLVGTGIVIGCLLAAAGSRLLESLLFGVGPIDPAAFVVPVAMFCIAGMAACYVPARRASTIEAAEALRSQ